MFTQEDNLIIQSYATASLLLELSKNKSEFLESEYYKTKVASSNRIMDWVFETTKEIDGQGTLLNVLYSMLVIPKEILDEKYKIEFKNLNEEISKIEGMDYKTNYSNEIEKRKEKINYIWHIRNAIAHGNVEFDPNNFVYFKDRKKFFKIENGVNIEIEEKQENFCLKIPLLEIRNLISELQKIFLKYLKDLKEKQEKMESGV